MDIVKKEVRTFIERAYCEICGTEMFLECELMVYPVTYKYLCSECSTSAISKIHYPKISYEQVDEFGFLEKCDKCADKYNKEVEGLA